MTNRSKTLYTGFTSNLAARLFQHKHRIFPGFTAKYNIDALIYYEEFSEVEEARCRERQIKGWRRDKKIALVESVNPGWLDLSRSDIEGFA